MHFNLINILQVIEMYNYSNDTLEESLKLNLIFTNKYVVNIRSLKSTLILREREV